MKNVEVPRECDTSSLVERYRRRSQAVRHRQQHPARPSSPVLPGSQSNRTGQVSDQAGGLSDVRQGL